MENQERLKTQYDDYGKTSVRMNSEHAKLLGYNMYATISQANSDPKRIQLFSLNSKVLEHVEASGAPLREPGTAVSYQLFFQKYRINVGASISGTETLPQGIVKTTANLEFNPELVEILDEYWYNYHKNQSLNQPFKMTF